jgi:hypothetical protein
VTLDEQREPTGRFELAYEFSARLPWESATLALKRGDRLVVGATGEWGRGCVLSCAIVSDGVELVARSAKGQVSCEATVPF